jgi:hypothetical protein
VGLVFDGPVWVSLFLFPGEVSSPFRLRHRLGLTPQGNAVKDLQSVKYAICETPVVGAEHLPAVNRSKPRKLR